MWIVVYTTEIKKQADKVKQLLESEGVLLKVRPYIGKSEYYELLVLESEAHEALSIIMENNV